MTMPQRIQRKRSRGWRMPEGAIYAGRPTKWSNPFIAGESTYLGEMVVTVEDAVRAYTDMLLRVRLLPDAEALRLRGIDDIKRELRGRDLVCWCKPGEPCHADVLLQIANSESDHQSSGAGEGHDQKPT